MAIQAAPEVVWDDLRHIDRHVDWMADAQAIRFLSPTTEGMGTTFECDTKVGPLRLTDRMEVTQWEPGRAMGVKHSGLVVGSGEFVLRPLPGGRCDFVWTEQLVFPWRLGGPVGAWLAVPLLQAVWRRSLRTFAGRFERPQPRP